MLYLENILNSMDNKADIIVLLSGNLRNEWTDQEYQYCCGNHHAENWMGAIEEHKLQKVFMVESVTVKSSSFSDRPQWTVTLINELNSITSLLDRAANEVACNRIINSIVADTCGCNNHA